MNSKIKVVRNVAAMACLGALVVAGCSTTGPERAARAAASMETVKAEVEKVNGQIDVTLAALNDLVSKPQENLKPQFDAYTQAVKELEAQAKLVGQRADDMRASGAAYFEAWEKSSTEITNPELRQHSEQRHAKLQQSFQTISEEYTQSQEKFGPFLASLADIQKLLSMDLTSNGLTLVTDLVKKANADGAAAKEEIEAVAKELGNVARLLAPPAPTS